MTSPSPYQFHETILRAYDIRGIIGETLSENDAYHLGLAYAAYVKRETGGNRICVGMDGRLSSPSLEEALVKGMVESGADVIRVGLGPTPLLYFSVPYCKADAGIMVTGSHNPPHHNGFKMLLKNKALFGESILDIGKIAAKGDYIQGSGSVSFEALEGEYLKHLLAIVEHANLPEDATIVWDAGNGATGKALEALVSHLPGKHLCLYTEINGSFPNHPADPTVPENMKDLTDAVLKNNAQLGIGFDGDGDRLGVVDDTGRLLFGDQLMMLFSRDLLSREKGATIIADVKASQGLFDDIAAHGGNPIMWKTGHSLIKTKMKELKAPLAGEMSGHIFFGDNHGFDDGMFAALKLIKILSEKQQPLSELINELPSAYSTPELRIEVDESRKFKVIDDVKALLKNAVNDENISTVDGLRVKSDKGWWVLRASNTQAALVARCEASSQENLQHIEKELKNLLSNYNISW